MQKSTEFDAPQTIGILLFDAFSNHCLANAVEPLRAANMLSGRTLYHWQFLSPDGGPVASSSGLPVQPEAALGRHPGGAFLFVMPSYGARTHTSPALTRGLRAARGRFDTLVGLDMGSWLLAASGLLDGRRATIHWDEWQAFAETFPDVRLSQDRVVRDGNVMSCGGVATAFELALELIAERHGPMLRLEVASLFMAGEIAAPLPPAPRDRRADKAVALMRRNLEHPLPIPELARQVGMPVKALSALCRRRHGVAPRKLYQAIRLREARRLVTQTPHSVAEIADRCGYQDASAMTRAFRAEFGTTPQTLRR